MLRPLLAVLILLLTPVASAQSIPAADNLAETAQAAQDSDRPILVFFYMDECQYCATVKKQYLKPMSQDPAYTDRVLLRKVDTRSTDRITDFSGQPISQQEFAKREDKTFTPTLAFYGPGGRELAKPLVGLKGGTDFYGYYLDKAIDDAVGDLRGGD
jgi:thioredoxin-related protein